MEKGIKRENAQFFIQRLFVAFPGLDLSNPWNFVQVEMRVCQGGGAMSQRAMTMDTEKDHPLRRDVRFLGHILICVLLPPRSIILTLWSVRWLSLFLEVLAKLWIVYSFEIIRILLELSQVLV